MFVSLDGDLNLLYEYLIKKSLILNKLAKNMMIFKVLIIKNENITKNQKIIKSNLKVTKEDYENTNKAVVNTKKYLDYLSGIKSFFTTHFCKAQLEQILTRQTINLEKIKMYEIIKLSGKKLFNFSRFFQDKTKFKI